MRAPVQTPRVASRDHAAAAPQPGSFGHSPPPFATSILTARPAFSPILGGGHSECYYDSGL